MSTRPTNQNIAQHILWKTGAKDMGPDLVNVSKDSEVRMHGLKKLGRYAGGLVLAAGLVVGGAELTGYAFDHSPTVVYQKHLQEQEHNSGLPTPPPAEGTPNDGTPAVGVTHSQLDGTHPAASSN